MSNMNQLNHSEFLERATCVHRGDVIEHVTAVQEETEEGR